MASARCVPAGPVGHQAVQGLGRDHDVEGGGRKLVEAAHEGDAIVLVEREPGPFEAAAIGLEQR